MDVEKKEYKVLVEWEVSDETSPYHGSHAAGSVVEVDEETAAPLVEAGTLEEVAAPEGEIEPSNEETAAEEPGQEPGGSNHISNPGND